MPKQGDSRFANPPGMVFSTAARPLVGTNPLYVGRELASQMEARCPPHGSPGPKYLPMGQKTAAGNDEPHGRTFGAPFALIDKRNSPGPANYLKATAPNLGFQRIDSTTASMPMFGLGSGTRAQRDLLHLDKKDRANLPSRMLLDVDEWASVQQQETDAQDDEAKGAWRSMKRRKKRLKRMMQHMMDPIANFLAPTMGLFGPLRAAGMFGGGMEPTGRFGMMREMEPEEPPSLTLQLGSAGGGDPFEELEQPSTAVTDSLRELFNATEVTLGGEPRGEGRSWNWSSKGTAGEGNVQVFTFP